MDAATASSSDDRSGVNPPSGKNGTYATPCICELVHKRIVITLDDVEEILYADDLRDLLRLRELATCDIAQTEMTDQYLTLKLGEHG